MELYNKGTKYLEKGNAEKAVQFLRKALRVEGAYKETYLNLGNAYRLLLQYENAVNAYTLAAAYDTPNMAGKLGAYPLAINNLGLMAFTLGDDTAAIAKYNECLNLDPLHYDAIWNYSIALLRRGCSGEDIDWAAAWKMYSYRFKRSAPTKLDRSIPLWDGVSRVDSICVLAEQGLGDKIMFGKYISRLYEYTDKIYVQCPPELDFIFSGFECVREATGSYGVPFCSLASKFDPSLSDNTPWLAGLRVKRSVKLFDKPSIGIVWSGSASHPNDKNRSMPTSYTRSFTELGELTCLNPGASAPKWIKSSVISSFEDTIAELNKVDILITCDTSIVHLAGSMGIPTIMFQPLFETDFRWGSSGDCRIYPSVKIVRDCSSWEEVVAGVKLEFGAWLAKWKMNNITEFVVGIEDVR